VTQEGPNRDEAEQATGEVPVADPLAAFRNWRAFFFVAVVVNALFVHGMWGGVADPKAASWIKTLSWFPFNVIATALYYAFMVKLGQGAGGPIYRLLCAALIAANWIALIVA
jgi:hypothetical protein